MEIQFPCYNESVQGKEKEIALLSQTEGEGESNGFKNKARTAVSAGIDHSGGCCRHPHTLDRVSVKIFDTGEYTIYTGADDDATTIMIDPGTWRYDSGSLSMEGIMEKDITLQLGLLGR